MNLHEYQAKSLLANYGLPILGGKLASTLDEAVKVAQSIAGVSVVKAQIHAGGRGKGGGVKVCQNLDEVKEAASKILGMTLVTPQTGEAGKLVRKIYIEEGCDIDKMFYIALMIDRATSRITCIASADGGMDVEEVAEKHPEKIVKFSVDPATGWQGFHGRKLATLFGLTGDNYKALIAMMQGLYTAFNEIDASLIEINPLAITKQGKLIALDAKVTLDDNALFRHKDLLELHDKDEEDARELEAIEHGLQYIKLDGDIGCMVNGAGLAMATMDIIQLHGRSPANFLDVGGGASLEKVSKAFEIILKDQNVRGVLVNIFGGIMKCDIIAQGIIDTARTMNIQIPIVVRLEGTNNKEGRELLAKSGLNIITASDIKDAAIKIVEAVSK